jgi:hypothetical protein
MFVSKNTFLNLFDNTDKLNFNKFLKFKVKTSQKQVDLKEYIDSTNKLKPLFQHIISKDEYLERFYDTSLEVEDDITIQEKAMKAKYLDNNEHVKYKSIIRNLHYKEILKNTSSGIDNVPTFLKVLEDLYNNNIIDYKLLTPSALHYISENRTGSVFSTFYFRASIMNPYLVYSLNHNVLKGERIFTPTLGWTSYCYGFLECEYVKEYVGTDVIKSVCNKTEKFAKKYYPNKKIDIFECPSESLEKKNGFLKKYKNHFDTVFFSPPYFKLELYSGKNQSTTLYKTYEEWLEKYWEKTIQLCYNVLEKNGKLCYILSGYGKDLEFNLIKDMNNITKKYFKYVKTIPMHNKNANMTHHRETGEKIIIFVKTQ